MKRFLLTGCILIASALALSASPAWPGRIRYTQPDGSVITIMRHGDEWGHWTTDELGRTVVKDADGYYRPVSGNEARAIRSEAASRRAAARRNGLDYASPGIASGPKHFLVILVEFDDLAFNPANDRTAFSNLMNEQGYSVNGGTGSARDYYYQNSGGLFDPTFDVYGPVKLPKNKYYYGGNGNKNRTDSHPGEAIRDACLLLDDTVDFSQYDNNGDGKVDLVFMYYAGYGAADSSDEDAIWPHKSWLSSSCGSIVLDGKTIDSYACTNEISGQGPRMGQLVGIGTACHEFGHALGLPDFYDTDYELNGIAGGMYDFSLMSGGNYTNEGRTPPSLNIIERMLLGWLDGSALTEITTAGNYTLTPLQENHAYKTATDQDGEYFVYECRNNTSWDTYLGAAGMFVYHVDKSSRLVNILNRGEIPASQLWSNWLYTNAINENGSHPCCYVVPAASQRDLKFGYLYIEQYGSYYFDPYREGVPAYMSFPGALGVSTFVPRSWSGVDSPLKLSNISYAGGQVTFTVTVPAAGLDYYSIQNPGDGVYAKGGSFALALNDVPSRPYSAVQWYFDGAEVAGASVPLTAAGLHTVEAVITLQDGKSQTITLDLYVQ